MGAKILKLHRSGRSVGNPLGPKFSIWLSEGGPISDHFLSNSSIYEAKGVQIETPKYAFRKVLKKGDLMTSQNSENGVPV